MCNECQKNKFDKDGNIVNYSNIDFCGGFISYHQVTNISGQYEVIEKSDHECWINGYKCYADEARFGGIVIEWIEEPNNYVL